MTKVRLSRLLVEYGLVPVGSGHPMSPWPETESGFVCGANDTATLDQALIVGGPCISHCEADFRMLRWCVLVDVLFPLFAARRLNRPCLIYLFVPIERSLVGIDDPDYETWRSLGDRLERWIERIAVRFGTSDLIIFRTDRRAACDLLEAGAELIRGAVNQEVIWSMYAVGSGGMRMSRPEAWRVRNNERNAACYQPAVLSTWLKRGVKQVVACENLHQAAAIKVARDTAYLFEGSARIGQVAYVTPPSLSGKSQMSRSPSSTARLGDSADACREHLAAAHPLAREYWQHRCWPSELLDRAGWHDGVDALVDCGRMLIEDSPRTFAFS
jgi:hypothetical protein